MYDKLKNLKDYNDVRIDLDNAGGSKALLYTRIGDAAVKNTLSAVHTLSKSMNAKPTDTNKFYTGLITGSIITITVFNIAILGKLVYDALKSSKKVTTEKPKELDEYEMLYGTEIEEQQNKLFAKIREERKHMICDICGSIKLPFEETPQEVGD